VGFDHKLSLEPAELAGMIRDIRLIEKAWGTGQKAVSEQEMVTRRKYHVSIVAAREIGEGEVIRLDMLTLKNPGTGLPARRMNEVIGKKAAFKIPADTLLSPEMLASE